MSKSYKTFSDWLNDQSESVQKRMEMISGALAWDQALLHSEHVKQLEASHRIKMDNGNQPVNAQLLAALKDLFEAATDAWGIDRPCVAHARAAIAAAEQQPQPTAKPLDWSSYLKAQQDSLFHEARAIMGTENIGQDDALRRAIIHVLGKVQPPASEPVDGTVVYFAFNSDDGMETFNTKEAAIFSATDAINSYGSFVDHEEGWPEATDSICYGVILGKAQRSDNLYVLSPLAPQPAVPDGYAPIPYATPCELTTVELRAFKLGWLECEAAHQAMLAAAKEQS